MSTAQYAVTEHLRHGQSVQLQHRQCAEQRGNRASQQYRKYRGILDYAPIPNAYKELTSFQIANESAHHARRRDADFLQFENHPETAF